MKKLRADRADKGSGHTAVVLVSCLVTTRQITSDLDKNFSMVSVTSTVLRTEEPRVY